MAPWIITSAVFAVMSGLLSIAVIRLRADKHKHVRHTERLQKSLERVEQTFGRFAPIELVDRLVADGIDIAAEHKEVTVLFADIRGFTQLTERLEADVLVELLNGYIKRMSGVISKNHGVVNKLIGDGIMATFGAVRPNAWQAADAVTAALEMIDELANYNRETASSDLPALSIGVGIHKGDVIVGIVGSEHLLEYTALGDVVNVAARVESLTRAYDATILITDAVQKAIGDRFRLIQMELTQVKGKSAAIQTFAVAPDEFGPI